MENDKSRIEALRIAMKNPHMAKLIVTGIKSPIRSSKRDQAKSVIDSVHIAQKNKTQKQMMPVVFLNQGKKSGGQGGPSEGTTTFIPSPQPAVPFKMSLKPATLSPYTFKAVEPEPMQVLPPVPSVGQGGPVEDDTNHAQGWFDNVMSKASSLFSKFTGQGGGLPANTSYGVTPSPLGNVSGVNIDLSKLGGGKPLSLTPPTPVPVYVNASPNTGLPISANPLPSGLPQVSIQDLNKPAQTPANNMQGLSIGAGSLPSGPLASSLPSLSFTGGTPAISNPLGNPAKSVDSTNKAFTSTQDFLNAGGDFSKVQVVHQPADQQISASIQFYKRPNSDVVYQNSLYKAPPSTQPAATAPITQGPTIPSNTNNGVAYGPGLDAQGKSTVPTITGDPLTDYLMTSLNEGIGSNAFALGVMADAKKLQSLFPGVPANKIPVGASLAGQLNDLQDTLTKEYKVNDLHDALTSAITTGQTLTPDVQSYIRGKDELLNTVDTMLNNATTEFWNSPMKGDPFYQKSMQQYTNYLTILKGRTTQRYIDYLNTAITYQNNQVQQLQTAYNSAADTVNKLYTSGAALTTEQYNQVKDTLTQMYDNTAARAGIMTATGTNAIDLQKSSADLAATVLKNAALISDPTARQNYIDQYGGTAGLSGLDANAIKTGTGSNNNLSAADLVTVDAQVGLAPDLNTALADPLLKQNGVPPDVIAQRYAQAKASSDSAAVKNDATKLDSLYSSFSAESKQLQATIDQAKTQGQDTTALQALKDNYDTTRDNAFLTGITDLVTANLPNIRKALNQMKTAKSYDGWASAAPGIFNFNANKNSADYSKFIALGQYLYTVAQANSNLDFSNTSASDIASAIFGQLPS